MPQRHEQRISGTYDPNGSTTAILTSTKNNSSINLPGLLPAAGATNAQVASFLSGNNGSASELAQRVGAGFYVGGTACSTP